MTFYILRDHHKGADKLNKYEWAKVRENDENGVPRCGTYWISEELLSKEYIECHPNLKKFIYLTDMMDTWKWASLTPQLTEAIDLSLVMGEIGMKDFDEYIYSKLLYEYEVDLLDEKMLFLLKYLKIRIKSETRSASYNKRIMSYTYTKDGVSIPLKIVVINTPEHGFIVAQNISELLKKYKIEYDAIIIYSFKKGLSIKTDADCKVPANELIKAFAVNGDGYIGAAGGSVDPVNVDKAYEVVFKGAKVIK